MIAAPSMTEFVLFELPSRSFSERLLAHVVTRRLAWLETGDTGAVVGVLLNPEASDLATLLRSVQSWLAPSGLGAIRFEVDGRTYVLESRQPALAAPSPHGQRSSRDDEPAPDRG